MKRTEQLIQDLPDPDEARRFLGQLAENHPSEHIKLLKNEGLLSDVLTLVSFSPLLAVTLLQNPGYFWWLNRKRLEDGVRGKDELLESLARFTLTNSQLEPQVLFARFRRRELVRIYLRDIRGLATIAEITEEISNLADAILESALAHARREMDNRFGLPQETDDKGRAVSSRFCIAGLGKLGSKELNYSSDIDLLFLYSDEGETSGIGSRDAVTNREYFIKLAEYTSQLIGRQTGEGAAYRVDLRLRPHGSLGALALSVGDTVRYFRGEARAWERQVLIRSRGCAGDIELFKLFFNEVEGLIFSKSETVETALANVRRSKEKIDLENLNRRGFDVKLGRGGIREIEFLAQALQLAYGGYDRWLRIPHTLISLSRLADRKHLSDGELTELSDAYKFLRRTEHVLQMENGVQTHTIPEESEKRLVVARRVMYARGGDFDGDLETHTDNVNRIFSRVFGAESVVTGSVKIGSANAAKNTFSAGSDPIRAVSPHFADMIASHPDFPSDLCDGGAEFTEPDYESEMMSAALFGVSAFENASRESFSADKEPSKIPSSAFGQSLSAMRQAWTRLQLGIVVADIFDKITIREAKRLQTKLAEASVAAALRVVSGELARLTGAAGGHDVSIPLDLAVLALGKLGSRGLDYDSDLDLVIVYFDPKEPIAGLTPSEFYSRAVELFSTTLSSMTRDGNLYRVDLRLRPFGSKGLSAMSIDAFLAYMADTAAIWEMLAFVKLRAVGGDSSLGFTVENETRRLVHQRAAALDPDSLQEETKRVRLALQNERGKPLRSGEIDIKYGSGGMLDIYFAVRYLQLRDNVPDGANDSSTPFVLARLSEKYGHTLSGGSTLPALRPLIDGYEFLSTLDHNLRLTIGRTTRIPLANDAALKTIATRMKLPSTADLLESLTLHRLQIRSAFDAILSE